MEELRFVVVEVEVEKGMENFQYPFRVLDTKTKEKSLSSFRTKDAAQAIADRQNRFEEIIGLTLDEAKVKLAGKYRVIRVAHKDGKDMMGTTDYRPDRLNVTVVNDKIIYVDFEG